MPSARKRALDEVDTSHVTDTSGEPSLLHQIRNMWQFANLFQWIMLFGKAVKVDDDLDIDDLEAECLTPHSTALQDIGLSLLKYLSSHRALTHDLFDEYTRRQYLQKAPDLNPFGDGETPARFADFDIFTKIRVLHMMTQFVMMNPEKLRERTEEQKDTDQANWRIEPMGWDRDDHTYFVLDDNRIYRLTEPTPPPPKPKKNSKKARASMRASKRRRISAALASDDEDDVGEVHEASFHAEPEDDGLGGMKWECIAATLDEVRQFLSTIDKTRDDNEKVLRDQLRGHLVPILEKQEDSRKRKQLQREKELLNLAKMAHAKRSSRIANKVEQQKMDEVAKEEDRKRRAEEETARKEEAKRLKLERERDKRLMSRQHRLEEREARRRQHTEELAQLSEGSSKPGGAAARMSERRLQAEIERNKQALKELEEEEDGWIFDCICGAYGHIDDGSHSVACERCNVWQHSKCLGINEDEAENDDFHFICASCRRREQAEKEGRPSIIRLKLTRPGSSSSAAAPNEQSSPPQPSTASRIVVEIPARPPVERATATTINGAGAALDVAKSTPSAAVVDHDGQATPAITPGTNGFESATTRERKLDAMQSSPSHNPFSSPHPTLSPPELSPKKSRIYETIHEQPTASAGTSKVLASTNGTRPAQAADSELTSSLRETTGDGSEQASQKHEPNGSPVQIVKTTPRVVPADLSSPVRNIQSTPIAPLAKPQLLSSQPSEQGEAGSPPLPPSRGGLSPTKHSPPVKIAGNGSLNGPSPAAGTGSTPAIYPPVAALSPSPRHQILTPPIKPTDPARMPLNSAQGLSSQQNQLDKGQTVSS